MAESHYIFIDGAYLDGCIRSFSQKFFGGEVLEICYDSLRDHHKRGFYYDCPIKRKEGQDEDEFRILQEEQEAKFKKIKETYGMHLFEGKLRGGRKPFKQKRVDVKLSVDMLEFAFRGNMTHATLLAGDSDFLPMVDSVVRTGVMVKLLCEKLSASKDLIYIADGTEYFDPWEISRLLPWSDPLKSRIPNPDSASLGSLGQRGFSEYARGQAQNGHYVFLLQCGSDLTIAYGPNPTAGLNTLKSTDGRLLVDLVEFKFGAIEWQSGFEP